MPTGSLRTCWPGGIRTDGRPPNVTGWIVPGTTEAPWPARAAVTWPTCRAEVPKTLVSTSRTRSPPTLGKMISRSVWSSKPAAASEPGTAVCGLALQLVIQVPRRSAAAGRDEAKTAIVAARTSRARATGNPSRISRPARRRPVPVATVTGLAQGTPGCGPRGRRPCLRPHRAPAIKGHRALQGRGAQARRYLDGTAQRSGVDAGLRRLLDDPADQDRQVRRAVEDQHPVVGQQYGRNTRGDRSEEH